MYKSVKNGIIVNPSSGENGKKWSEYVADFTITAAEIATSQKKCPNSGAAVKAVVPRKPDPKVMELQKQLVAAYIPGIGFAVDEFKTIPFMTSPDQIGGFVSWNTFKKGHYPKKDKNWYAGGVTSNPVTWDSSVSTNLEQHKGFLYTNNKIYAKALKIEITDGLVWSSNPKFSMRLFMSLIKN